MEQLQIEGIDYLNNEHIKINVVDGIIHHIESLPKKNNINLPYIGPGLIDIQVNGFYGVDFNSPGIQPHEIKSLTDSLAKEGVTTFFPTLVTNSVENINLEISGIIKACKIYPKLEHIVAGIHLEGPFISKSPETRGAHNEKFIQAPDWEMLEQWQELAKGKIKIITISPEWPNSDFFIEKCIENDILVAIGHTSATPDQIKNAVRAGATLSTHLGNGSHLNISRENNYFWEQLSNDKLCASIIADGFHVDNSLIKVMLRVKKDNLILISDSTYFSNLAPGTYSSIIGNKVILDENGRLFMESEPRLMAGSAKSILFGINHLIKNNLSSLSKAWDMASVLPAKLLKLRSAIGISVGAPADLVLFTIKNNQIVIRETIKSGTEIFSNTLLV